MDAQDEETPKHGKKTRHHNDRKQKAREAQGTHMRKAQEVGQEQRSRKWSRMVQHRRPGMRFAKRSNPRAQEPTKAAPRAFIVCTELTIKANSGPVRNGEDRWTLGQTLDLFLPNAYLHQETIKLVLAQESLRLNHTRSIMVSLSVPFSN